MWSSSGPLIEIKIKLQLHINLYVGSFKCHLMSLALLFLYLMLNMFRMLIHPSSGACNLCAKLFRGLH